MSKLFDRIGVDINQKLPLEAAVDWTVKHKVPFIDLCLDQTPELLRATDSSRLTAARKRLEKAGAQLGLHTLSAVNIAETSPFVAKAADDYLAAYIDAAKRLGAGWIVVHGGHHFTSDKQARMDAAVARIARAAKLAEKKKAKILLENLNPEPERAEVHYLCADLEECQYYFDRLDSPALGWSFTVNHAHIQPNRIPDVHGRPRHEALRRGAHRRLPRHARGAPAARRRHDRFSRHVRRASRRADTAGITCRRSAAWMTCSKVGRHWPDSRKKGSMQMILASSSRALLAGCALRLTPSSPKNCSA